MRRSICEVSTVTAHSVGAYAGSVPHTTWGTYARSVPDTTYRGIQGSVISVSVSVSVSVAVSVCLTIRDN
eukprot:1311655-Rhodomonas_salina.1